MPGLSNYRSVVSNRSTHSPLQNRGIRGQGLSQQYHQGSSVSQVDHGQISSVIVPPRNFEYEFDLLRFEFSNMSRNMDVMKQHVNGLHAHYGLPLIDFNASDIASQMENVLSTLTSATNAVDATENTQQAPSGENVSVLNPDNKAITGNLGDDTDSGPALVDPTKSVVQYPENALVSSQASSTDKMNHLGDVLNPLTEAVGPAPSSHLPHTEEVAKMGATANAHDMLQEKTSMVVQKASYSDIAKIGNDSPGQPKRSTPDQSHVHALPTTPIQQAKKVITSSKGNNKQSGPSTTKPVVQSGGLAEQDSNKKKPHQESTLADDFTVPHPRNLALPRPPSSMERALAEITSGITMEHLIPFAKAADPSASPSQQGKVTPSKRATEKRKGSSSSKKSRMTKKSTFSSATKKQDLIDETDFQAQQDEVTKFDKGIREVIGEYVVFMAENSKESRFTTPDGSQTLLDEILSSTIQMSSGFITPFALACFSSRLASYSSRSDMESQKMRALLKAIRENGNSSIIKQDFNFLFGIKRSRDEHIDIENRYRTMLEEFDKWKSVPLLDQKKTFEEDIESYSELMGLSRVWNCAYKSDRKTSNEFYNNMANFIDERRHRFKNQHFDLASVNLKKRIEHHRNSNEPGSDVGEAFYTALSKFKSEVVQEDIVFMFLVLCSDEKQERFEASYADMVLTFDTWNKFTPRSGPITRTEVEKNPVRLSEELMTGFINHINSQCIHRNNLNMELDSEDPDDKVMTPKESAVLGAYKSLFLEARSFTLENCREFLVERVELLSADPTSHQRIHKTLYEFLIQVDSSIVTFDTFFFKKCIKEKSVPKGFGLDNDKDFLNQMFRIKN